MIMMIYNAIKFSFLQIKCTHPAYDGMIRYDYSIGHKRENLMILCFSHLTDLKFILVCILFWIFGPILSFSLQNGFLTTSENMNVVLSFMLDGRFSQMTIVFLMAFFIQWIFRWTSVFIIFIFILLNQGDLHLNLAVAFILGIYLSRSCLMWWMRIDLLSQTKKIWSWWTGLQLTNSILIIALTLFFLDQMHAAGYFSSGLKANRSEFTLILLIFNMFLQFMTSSAWGHFYYQIKADPSDLPTRYSTATWFLRIKVAQSTENTLKSLVVSAIQKLNISKQQSKELKDQGLVLGLEKMTSVIESELNYLQMASARLTVD